MDANKKQMLREIEVDTEKEFHKKLRANKNKVYATNLVAALLRKIDNLVGFVINERKVKFDCAAGCSHCCVLRVDPLVPEIFYMAEKIKKLPGEERAQIIRDLENYCSKVQGMSAGEHLAARVPCVFLKNDSCSIYEFRPFSCRKWHSLDVTACKLHTGSIPGNEELAMKAEAMVRGFARAYEKNNLPVIPSEFRQALLVALTDDSAMDRWFRGEEVFVRLPEFRDSGLFLYPKSQA